MTANVKHILLLIVLISSHHVAAQHTKIDSLQFWSPWSGREMGSRQPYVKIKFTAEGILINRALVEVAPYEAMWNRGIDTAAKQFLKDNANPDLLDKSFASQLVSLLNQVEPTHLKGAYGKQDTGADDCMLVLYADGGEWRVLDHTCSGTPMLAELYRLLSNTAVSPCSDGRRQAIEDHKERLKTRPLCFIDCIYTGLS